MIEAELLYTEQLLTERDRFQRIYEIINSNLRKGNKDVVNEVFSLKNNLVEKLSIESLLAILSFTSRAHWVLPARALFFERVRQRIIKERSSEFVRTSIDCII